MEFGVHQVADHIQSSVVTAQFRPGVQIIHLFQQILCYIGLEINDVTIGSAGTVIVGVIDIIGIFPEYQVHRLAVFIEHILLLQKGKYRRLKIPSAAARNVSQIRFPDHVQIGSILGSRLTLCQLQLHDLRRLFHGRCHGSLDLGMYFPCRHIAHNAVGQKQRQEPAE